MMFVFESDDGNLYNCPDSYIYSQKQGRVAWGAELIIHSVFCKGSPVLTGFQTIYVTFNHEGSYGSALDSNWLLKDTKDTKKNWYTNTNLVKMIDMDRIVMFDLGPKHPHYFRTKEDLGWYIQNIYALDYVMVDDGN